ncbi:hypothetical protein B0H13DRAFT_2669684 [Mycena leptocephala]|nr:hypothetical protein B0H13DRAFT_2669684 [Mycena leptocephala]
MCHNTYPVSTDAYAPTLGHSVSACIAYSRLPNAPPYAASPMTRHATRLCARVSHQCRRLPVNSYARSSTHTATTIDDSVPCCSPPLRLLVLSQPPLFFYPLAPLLFYIYEPFPSRRPIARSEQTNAQLTTLPLCNRSANSIFLLSAHIFRAHPVGELLSPFSRPTLFATLHDTMNSCPKNLWRRLPTCTSATTLRADVHLRTTPSHTLLVHLSCHPTTAPYVARIRRPYPTYVPTAHALHVSTTPSPHSLFAHLAHLFGVLTFAAVCTCQPRQKLDAGSLVYRLGEHALTEIPLARIPRRCQLHHTPASPRTPARRRDFVVECALNCEPNAHAHFGAVPNSPRMSLLLSHPHHLCIHSPAPPPLSLYPMLCCLSKMCVTTKNQLTSSGGF